MKTHAVELIASVVQPLAFDLVVLVGVAIELADIVCPNSHENQSIVTAIDCTNTKTRHICYSTLLLLMGQSGSCPIDIPHPPSIISPTFTPPKLLTLSWMDAEVVERQTHENISPSADFAKKERKKKEDRRGGESLDIVRTHGGRSSVGDDGVVPYWDAKERKIGGNPLPKRRKGIE